MMGGKQKGTADIEDLMVAERLVGTRAPIYLGRGGQNTSSPSKRPFSFALSLFQMCFVHCFPQAGISAEGY